MKNIIIPSKVEFIIEELEKSGYEAYIVGGCVRDIIMGKEPHDYDITTSATPEETMEVFKAHKQFDQGLKHGTVNLVLDEEHFEITTHRTEDQYSDNRRPDKVTFVKELDKDLGRRDFTINAIAYSHKGGIEDPLNGKADIENKVIKAVGEPSQRFIEDALRIIRGLRFASVLGFEIETNTKQAMIDYKELLKNVSRERITIELIKLLQGPSSYKILMQCSSIFSIIIPQILNKEEIWNQAALLAQDTDNIILKLTILLKDLGNTKQESEEIAKEAFERLRLDNHTQETVLKLIGYNREITENKIEIKKSLHYIGEYNFKKIIEIKKLEANFRLELNSGLESNVSCKSDLNLELSFSNLESEISQLNKVENIMNQIIIDKECINLKELNLKGNELIKLGIPKGKLIGEILENLLQQVIEEKVKNEKRDLEELVLKIWKSNVN